MRDLFPAYYRPDEDAFRTLWKDGTIALDANVLLNLHRYPPSARDDLVKALKSLGDRLFVPYQAALEYQRNRLEVIAGQRRKFGEVRKILAATEKRLGSEFGELELEKRHASIKADKLLADVKELFDKFRADLDGLEHTHPDVFGDDPVRDTLDRVLKGRVGPAPTQDQIDSIIEQGKKRYADHVPPGYADTEKGAGRGGAYTVNGVRFEAQYGDLFLWRQLIDFAADKKIKLLIFVTDDAKADWWWIVDSQGYKTIGPRPELVDEVRREAGVELFHAYSSERFLEYANKFLGTGLKPESIEQIREVKEESALSLRQDGLAAERAVISWLYTIHPANCVAAYQTGLADVIVETEDHRMIGYEVMRAGSPIALRDRLARFLGAVLARRLDGLDQLVIVVVLDDAAETTAFAKHLGPLNFPSNVTVAFGHMESSPDGLMFKLDLGQIPSRGHTRS